jgi:hypothetical protein
MALCRSILAVMVLAAALTIGRPESAVAAGGTISLASYQTTQVCHDGVCTKTSAPVSYLQVRGSGFSLNALVLVEIIRVSNLTVADTYSAIYTGGKFVVHTAVRFCPPNASAELFMVRAIDLLTMTYSNIVSGSVCPGSSL